MAGDDDGRIQLWDTRQAEAAGSFAAHTDYISDMAAHAPERALLATSGDGTLSVNDTRTFKVGICWTPATPLCQGGVADWECTS